MNLDFIKKILFEDWDPIKLNWNKLLKNEYDNYAQKLYKELLSTAVSEEQLIELLTKYEDQIGVSTPLFKKQCVANKIIELKRQVK